MALSSFSLSHAKYYTKSLPHLALKPTILAQSTGFDSKFHSRGISETFSELKKQGKAALIPYVTAGDPDLATTSKILQLLDRCGADVIELGVPFFDAPLDGPVIKYFSCNFYNKALSNGITLDAILSMLKEVVPHLSCPIVLFSYHTPVFEYGIESSLSAIKDAGIHGLLVPDLSFDDNARLKQAAAENEVQLVLLTTPVTPRRQMEAIVDASQGFVYLVSSVGVTGDRATVNPQVELLLKEIKGITANPVAVGFGISNPEHVKKVASWGADGVIVGSAIVRLIGEGKSSNEILKNVETFVSSLKAALP
ncbi:tryptophan synthase alpha chain-like [Ananas comosus]|uniref:Tryptophan synthase alpha chain-like n=1 Tax=Ananas comosus TaxID=4615 RepID=A0A6P5GG98_ANACO|nr:tryptophan synthase alpha chain-like [Ananas comosus]